MDFPRYRLEPTPVTEAMAEALGVCPIEAWLDRDLMLVLDAEDSVRDLHPDMEALKALPGLLVGVTARGREYDCVSRVFAPKCGVPEDPVTGSMHCMIAPYWANVLGKDKLHAFQASERTGELLCRVKEDSVEIAGKAALFSLSDLYI